MVFLPRELPPLGELRRALKEKFHLVRTDQAARGDPFSTLFPPFALKIRALSTLFFKKIPAFSSEICGTRSFCYCCGAFVLREGAGSSPSESWRGQGAGCGVGCAGAALPGGNVPSPRCQRTGRFSRVLAF